MEGNWIPSRKGFGAVNWSLGADLITVFYGGIVHIMKISAGQASNLTVLLICCI